MEETADGVPGGPASPFARGSCNFQINQMLFIREYGRLTSTCISPIPQTACSRVDESEQQRAKALQR